MVALPPPRYDVINADVSSKSLKLPIQSSEKQVASLKQVVSLRGMQLGMCRFMIMIYDYVQHIILYTFIRGCKNLYQTTILILQ